MFSVVYAFEVKPGFENSFEQNWAALTELIYHYENSMGSRLHRSKAGLYIAYAQWPDKSSWKNSGKRLPQEANYTQSLKHSCNLCKCNVSQKSGEFRQG